jgi:hypothetical protein
MSAGYAIDFDSCRQVCVGSVDRRLIRIPIQVGGRAPFDGAGMHRRVDELLAAALRRT